MKSNSLFIFVLFLSLSYVQAQFFEGLSQGFYKQGQRQIGIRIGGGSSTNESISLIVPASKNTRFNFSLDISYLDQTSYRYIINNNTSIIQSIGASKEWINIAPTVIKDWVFPIQANSVPGLNWYVGVGMTAGVGFNLYPGRNNYYSASTGKMYKGDDYRFLVGFVGNIGIEYWLTNLNQKIPLVISLDARPAVGYRIPFTNAYGFHPTDVIWGSIGLGISYVF